MRRMPKRYLAIATITLSAGLFGSGCADNDSSLFVRAVLQQPSNCTVRADPTSTTLAGGTLDMAFASVHGGSYVAALLVGNQLAQVGNADQVRTETARITLRGAVVEVRDPSAGEDAAPIVEYTTDGTGFVDPSTGTNPGYGLMFVQLIPPGVLGGLSRVNVAVRVFGDTLGGDEIESSQLTFPITICNGCLIDYARTDPTTGVCAPPTETASGIEAPCRVGQDDPVDCRICAAAVPACASPATP